MAGERASGASIALYALLAAGALSLVLLPLSAPLQRRFLANHQLAPPSTASWIAVGLLPKMYGGRHEFWMSAAPVDAELREHPERAPFPIAHYWVNHSPGRAVRLDTTRDSAGLARASTWVRIESSYRGEARTSTYLVRAIDGRIEVRPQP